MRAFPKLALASLAGLFGAAYSRLERVFRLPALTLAERKRLQT